jgi:Fuc2NAc and GlcNAc transferase
MTAAAHSVAYVFVGSLAASWILVAAIRRLLLRRGLLDIPNARSSHVAPTPRGGGIAIVMVTMVAVAIDVALHQIPALMAVAWLFGGAISEQSPNGAGVVSFSGPTP